MNNIEDKLITKEDLLSENKDKIWKDENAKTLSYFCKNNKVVVDKGVIDALERISTINSNGNVRLCLHQNPQDTLHCMLILACRNIVYNPHKHIEKDEILQMIKGSMLALFFSEEGEVTEKYVLSPDENFLFKSPKNIYHLYTPITDKVIYSESKLGHFNPKDNIVPKWNPNQEIGVRKR